MRTRRASLVEQLGVRGLWSNLGHSVSNNPKQEGQPGGEPLTATTVGRAARRRMQHYDAVRGSP